MLRTLTGLSALAAMTACAPADPPMVAPFSPEGDSFSIEIAHLPVTVDGIQAGRVINFVQQECRPYVARAIVSSGFTPPENIADEFTEGEYPDYFIETGDNAPWFEKSETGARIQIEEGVFFIVRSIEGAPDGISISFPELGTEDRACRNAVISQFKNGQTPDEEARSVVHFGATGICEGDCRIRIPSE